MRKNKNDKKKSAADAGLTELFDESVVGEAVKLMSSAGAFALEDGTFVCLRFDASNVAGGLTKKSGRKNPEVGRFVSAVTSHRLYTYATRDMLLGNYLLIIPTEKTVAMMSEYDFLACAVYPLVVVDSDGSFNQTAFTMTFDDVRNVAGGRVPISSFFSAQPSVGVQQVVASAQSQTMPPSQQPPQDQPATPDQSALQSPPTIPGQPVAPSQHAATPQNAVPSQPPIQGQPVAHTQPASVSLHSEQSAPAQPVDNAYGAPANQGAFASHDATTNAGAPLNPANTGAGLTPSAATNSAPDTPAQATAYATPEAASETGEEDIVEAVVVDEVPGGVHAEAGDGTQESPAVPRRSRRRRSHALAQQNEAEAQGVQIENVSVDAEVDVPSHAIEKTMERRFFSREALVSVTSEAFDDMFRQEAVQISVPEEQGWLNDVVRYETVKANESLQRFHDDSIERLRRHYLDLLEEQYAIILDKTSLDEGSNGVYGQKMADISRVRDEALANLPQRVEQERTRLQEGYDEELRAEVEKAATEIYNDFKTRRGKVMNSELEAVPAKLRREIDATYSSHVAILKKDRREQIEHLMDRATAKVLRTIGAEYQNALEGEMSLRENLLKDISRLADDNREHEMHRVNVLEAELSRDTQLERVSREHSARLESMRQDFEATNSALRSEYDSALLRHSKELDELVARYERELVKKDEENASVVQELENLQRRFDQVGEEKRAEVGQELQYLHANNYALNQQLEEIAKSQKKTSWAGAITTVVATIVAAAVGIFVGAQIFG